MERRVKETLCAAFAAWSLSLGCTTAVPEAPPALAEIVVGTEASKPLDQAPVVRDVQPRASRDFSLRSDWRELSDEALDQLLARATQDEAVLRLEDGALADLGRALGASDATSVRAAVILGNTRDPRAFDVLVTRLEARAPEDARDVAGDVVAAAACASTAPDREALLRLDGLAVGGRPHPVMLVRVECALTSLSAGREACIPFLLDILREGTSAAVKSQGWRRFDWTDERVLRLQDRIARALCAAAQIENSYRARGPLAAREKEIARLARLLQASATPRGQ